MIINCAGSFSEPPTATELAIGQATGLANGLPLVSCWGRHTVSNCCRPACVAQVKPGESGVGRWPCHCQRSCAALGQPGSPAWLTAETPETPRWGPSCGRQPGRRPGRRDQTDGHGLEDNSKVIELKKIFQVLFNLQRLPRFPQYLQCLPNVFHTSPSICTCFAFLGPKCHYLHSFGPASKRFPQIF